MKQPHSISTCTTTQMSPQFHKGCSKGTHNCSTKLLTSDGSFPHFITTCQEAQAPHHSIIFFSSSLPTALSLSSPTPVFSIQVTSPMLYFPHLSSSLLYYYTNPTVIKGIFFPFKTLTSSLSYFTENRWTPQSQLSATVFTVTGRQAG